MTENASLFAQLSPGFFEDPTIRALDPSVVYEQMIFDLRDRGPLDMDIPVPENVHFGFFDGDYDALSGAVYKVGPHWVPHYVPGERIYCGYAGDEVVSFCLLQNFGTATYYGKTVRVAGPGCVGTVPEFRRQGIGLRMIRNATNILMFAGYDLSYINWTGVARWYGHLGYETLARWTSRGIIE